MLSYNDAQYSAYQLFYCARMIITGCYPDVSAVKIHLFQVLVMYKFSSGFVYSFWHNKS